MSTSLTPRTGAGSRLTSSVARFPIPAVVLVLWTLFVWGGRLRNLAADPGGLAEANRWSLGASIGFVALALAVGVAVLAGFGGRRPGRVALGLLAGAGMAVWAVRAVDIALGDHSVGFIAVHLVLAAVTVGLSVWAWRATPRYPPHDG
jgi:hypothetical protein